MDENHRGMKTTLRRILKYTPVVVLGLLIVAWAVSLHWTVMYVIEHESAPYTFSDTWALLNRGSIGLRHYKDQPTAMRPGPSSRALR
jgi:hypothetical protein